MAIRSFKDMKIELHDSASSYKDISQYITGISGVEVEQITEEITGAGQTNDVWGAVGVSMKSTVELSGPYNDTSTATLVGLTRDWNDASERRVRVTYDGVTGLDVKGVNCFLTTTRRNPVKGGFIEYVAVLRPTGAYSTA
jgi:hypothetical protein